LASLFSVLFIVIPKYQIIYKKGDITKEELNVEYDKTNTIISQARVNTATNIQVKSTGSISENRPISNNLIHSTTEKMYSTTPTVDNC
jgi:hypothetical protein